MTKDTKNKIVSYILNMTVIVLFYAILKLLIEANVISRYYQGIITMICINIIVASALNLVMGFLGQLALGHAGFMAIGSYGAALSAIYIFPNLSSPTLKLLLAILIGGLLAGIIGFFIGLPALRLRGDYLAIITLGFGEIIRVIINNIGITNGAQGLTGIPRITNITNVYWITVVVLVLLFTLTNSRHGRAIISIREDEIASESIGINTIRFKLLAFTFSAFIAGVGGGLFAHYLAFLDPNTFNFMKSVEIVVMVVLGGLGSLTGTIISASVLTALPELLRGFASYRLLIYSFVLILMMIFRPQGLFGTKEFSLIGLLRGIKNLFTKNKAERSES